MSHKRLSQYSVIAGGKLSKVIEFSKGEAEIYVRNFIETHLSHAVLKAAGGLKDITAYFSDTKQLKEKIEGQIKTVTEAIQDTINSIQPEIDGYIDKQGNIVPPLTGEAKLVAEDKITTLRKAADKISLAKQNVSEVKDDADFNKENIDQAKNKVYDSIEDLIKDGITSLISTTSSGDDNASTTTLNLNEEKNKIGKNLNKLRKWQFDKFEEEFSAEIYVGSYHEYKYAKTIEKLCDLLNAAIGSLGVQLDLKPEDYYVDGTEVYKIASSLNQDKMQRYDSKKQFPEEGKPDIYYFARGTDESGQWYRWTGKKYEECNLPDNFSTGNLETIIESKLTAKGLSPKRINIDWHNKNFDMADDPFEY